MIKFSIGIPAFKSAFLKDCVDSILEQTYQHFELIIINDCSPDPIEDVIRTYSDSRIKYFKNDKNTGAENVVDNWNKCLNESNGDYFVLMGDDDRLESDYLQEFVNLISKYPHLDVYHCRSKLINEESIAFGVTPPTPEFESIYDFVLACIKQQRQQYISDFVYKTSPLKEKGGFYKLPLAWASDYLSAYTACGKRGIAHTNKPVFNYRMNQYSITSTSSLSSIILKRKATVQYENWIDAFSQETPEQPEDILKVALIKSALLEHCTGSRIGMVRQILSHPNLMKGIVNIFTYKKLLYFSTKDVIAAYSMSLSNKVYKWCTT